MTKKIDEDYLYNLSWKVSYLKTGFMRLETNDDKYIYHLVREIYESEVLTGYKKVFFKKTPLFKSNPHKDYYFYIKDAFSEKMLFRSTIKENFFNKIKNKDIKELEEKLDLGEILYDEN
jgi:hypothetical protein